MAFVSILKSTDVRRIWARITCPECHNSYNVQMKDSQTRKNCRMCGDCTFYFVITPHPSLLDISAQYSGADLVMREYPLKSSDIEIEEE